MKFSFRSGDICIQFRWSNIGSDHILSPELKVMLAVPQQFLPLQARDSYIMV